MSEVNRSPQAGIVHLANIAIAERAYERLMGRGADEPGLATLHGPSGYGKSTAAAWLAARRRAYYVQADDFWTKKTMLVAISKAIGLRYTRGKGDAQRDYVPDIYTMAEAIKAQLHNSGRLLIVDEFDYCVEKGLVEATRSLYEGSKASILLIGEELLPQKLEKWERFHGRMLDWFPAQPAGLDDLAVLAAARCPGLTLRDDLARHLVDLASGSVRRLGNNLSLIQEAAMENGWEAVDLARVQGGKISLRIRSQAGEFTLFDVCPGRVPTETARDYLNGLTRAGYLAQVGTAAQGEKKRYRLERDAGIEAPRVRRDGGEVTQGGINEAMWGALQVLDRVTAAELADLAGATPGSAKTYCMFLARAGYLTVARPGKGHGRGGDVTVYRVNRARLTGPRAPMITRVKAVYDPNLHQVVWMQGADDLAEELDAPHATLPPKGAASSLGAARREEVDDA